MSFQWIGKSQDGNTVVLSKLGPVATPPDYATQEWLAANADKVRSAIVLDVETTGLNPHADKIIEIGLRRIQFNRTNGEILGSDFEYAALQDPGVALSDEVKMITGLEDKDLRGKAIDWEKVDGVIAESQIIIAHNAIFDRTFVDRSLPISETKIWACSLRNIDWFAKGFQIQKLEVLGIYHGFFTDSHRAINDVNALTHLLGFKDEHTGQAYLNELLTNARRPLVRVVAQRAPFDTKDLLKARKYTWDNGMRAWFKAVYKDEMDQENLWLSENIYKTECLAFAEEISSVDNFKMNALG